MNKKVFDISMGLVCAPISTTIQDIEKMYEYEKAILLQSSMDNQLQLKLYSQLKKLGALKHFETSWIQKLDNLYWINFKNTLKQIHCVKKINDLMENHNIKFCVLKEYGIHPFDQDELGTVIQCDLDILINEDAVTYALRVLENHGFVILRYANREITLRCQESGVLIDLHSTLTNLPQWYEVIPENLEEVLARCDTIRIDNEEIPILSKVDAVFYLLSHLAVHHNFIPLSKLVNTWNYLYYCGDDNILQQTAKEMKSRRISALGWFSMDYMRKILNKNTDGFKHFLKPSSNKIKAFNKTFPSPENYYLPKVQKDLEKMLYRKQLKLFMDNWIDRVKHDLTCIRISHFERKERIINKMDTEVTP